MIEKERYSQISRRMWRDSRFLSLSAPKPNAQSLWVYLLTGPHCTNIPGLFVMGEMALSEALDWPLGDLKRCFSEILAAKMAHFDRRTKLFWAPNGIRHNPPNAPNVVLGWRESWRELPECELRDKAAESLLTSLESISPGFAEAFARVCGRPYAKPSGKPLAKPSPKSLPIQEQEQEQEQDPEGGTIPEGSREGTHPSAKPSLLEQCCRAYADGIASASGAVWQMPDPNHEGPVILGVVQLHRPNLRGTALADWIKRSAATYRRVTADDWKYQRGFRPTKWAEWLNAGGSALTSGRPTGTVDPLEPSKLYEGERESTPEEIAASRARIAADRVKFQEVERKRIADLEARKGASG